MKYGKGFVLVACTDTEDNLQEIRKYIKRHALTQEQVKIVRNEEGLFLKVKTEVTIGA